MRLTFVLMSFLTSLTGSPSGSFVRNPLLSSDLITMKPFVPGKRWTRTLTVSRFSLSLLLRLTPLNRSREVPRPLRSPCLFLRLFLLWRSLIMTLSSLSTLIIEYRYKIRPTRKNDRPCDAGTNETKFRRPLDPHISESRRRYGCKANNGVTKPQTNESESESESDRRCPAYTNFTLS